MDQKWANIGFQSQISKSNIDTIHLKIIFYLEYWISRTFYSNVLIWLIDFWKTLFTKIGPYFCGSYPIQNKLIQKSICWHQLFRQKWAFPRLSTSVLHKCGHTKLHSYFMLKPNTSDKVYSAISINSYKCIETHIISTQIT